MSQRAFILLKGYSDIHHVHQGDLVGLCCSQAAKPSFANIHFSEDLLLPSFGLCFVSFFAPVAFWMKNEGRKMAPCCNHL